jgi:hypothetical protein
VYKGRPADAIPWYVKALQLEPNHGLTRFFLGQAYLGMGRSSDAINEFRRAAQAMDDPPFARQVSPTRSRRPDNWTRQRRFWRNSKDSRRTITFPLTRSQWFTLVWETTLKRSTGSTVLSKND